MLFGMFWEFAYKLFNMIFMPIRDNKGIKINVGIAKWPGTLN